MKKIRVVLEIGLNEDTLKEEGVKPEELLGQFLVSEDYVVDGVTLTREVVKGHEATDRFFLDGTETFIVSSEIVEA